MANYKYVTDFLNDLRMLPGEENIICEDGRYKLSQDYAIRRMNHIFGKGNWNILNVRNELQKNAYNNTAQNVCSITVEYVHPISGQTLSVDGSSPMNFTADENVVHNAFLNAISCLGFTFGELLNKQQAIIAELPAHNTMLAAVI